MQVLTWGFLQECPKGEQDFCELVKQGFNNPEYCDVIVVADNGTEFHCSKFLLKLGSEYFNKMFSHDMKEQLNSEVSIKEVDSNILEKALLFMHSGKCEMDETDFLPMMSFAHR